MLHYGLTLRRTELAESGVQAATPAKMTYQNLLECPLDIPTVPAVSFSPAVLPPKWVLAGSSGWRCQPQAVDATVVWSLLVGVWNPKVFLGRGLERIPS